MVPVIPVIPSHLGNLQQLPKEFGDFDLRFEHPTKMSRFFSQTLVDPTAKPRKIPCLRALTRFLDNRLSAQMPTQLIPSDVANT